jgi:hypothetical protein
VVTIPPYDSALFTFDLEAMACSLANTYELVEESEDLSLTTISLEDEGGVRRKAGD